MSKANSLFFGLLFVGGVSYAALSKTYPTSATTQIRWDAYHDAFKTVWLSTSTEFTRINEDGSTTDFGLSTATIEAIKLKWINEVEDDGIEQYLVFPSTFAPSGWKGWCLQVINGRNVPAACP
jgi:hypothetical protein